MGNVCVIVGKGLRESNARGRVHDGGPDFDAGERTRKVSLPPDLSAIGNKEVQTRGARQVADKQVVHVSILLSNSLSERLLV